jgi:hypothetical protein
MSVVRFHEKAVQIFACKQNAEFNSAVKSTAETTGTVRFGSSKVLTVPALANTNVLTIGTVTFTATGSVSAADLKRRLLDDTLSVANLTVSAGTLPSLEDIGGTQVLVFSPGSAPFPTITGSGVTLTLSSDASTKYVVGGPNCRFKYQDAEGDGLGQATVGMYIRRSGALDTNIGRIESVLSNTVLLLENLDDTARATDSKNYFYAFDFGPKNAVAVLNLTYSLETTSEAFLYSGDENEIDEKTVITDRYGKIDFETFVPAVDTAYASKTLEGDYIPMGDFFNATGLKADTSVAGSVTYTTENSVDSYLTIEIRRSSSSSTFNTLEKAFTYTDVRGTVDFDAVIGTKAKLKWAFMGNFKRVTDKQRITPDPETRALQKSRIAANISADSLTTCQMDLESFATTVQFLSDLPASKKVALGGLIFNSIEAVTPEKLSNYFTNGTLGLQNGVKGSTLNDIYGIGSSYKIVLPPVLKPGQSVTVGNYVITVSGSVNRTAENIAKLLAFLGSQEGETATRIAAAKNRYGNFTVTNRTAYPTGSTIRSTLAEYEIFPVDGEPGSVSFYGPGINDTTAVPADFVLSAKASTDPAADAAPAITSSIIPGNYFSGTLNGYATTPGKASNSVMFYPVLPNRGTEALSLIGTSATSDVATLDGAKITGLSIASIEKASALTMVDGRKNVCFDKLSSPNFSSKEYVRIQTGCGDGWSRGSVPTDVSLTITEEQANASYNPDNHLEEDHALYVKWTSGSGYVLVKFNKLQLVKVTNSTVGNYAGQDLSFRKIGISSITLKG